MKDRQLRKIQPYNTRLCERGTRKLTVLWKKDGKNRKVCNGGTMEKKDS
jgi:hypothetical protein